ncbi:MAG: endonuclease/exonuclease/phosphatase family protein [Bacteroidales bacterium]|nr:endonuclease/exonuclease/phosphatase family protein [Bacteroidales bacterium]
MIILMLLPAMLSCPPWLCAWTPDRAGDYPAIPLEGVQGVKASGNPQDSLLFVFWNVENFFDYHSTGKPQYWTAGRFYAKCDGIAKTLLRIADRYGRLPDAVGFAEVENGFVLHQLLSATALRKLDYRIVHFDSPDHRGIDCALLCRRSTLPMRRSAPKHVPDSTGGVMATRDILLAEFDSLAVLVNHHPSQIGGKSGRRDLARERLRALTDSLRDAGTRRILSIGDFNEDVWKDGEGTLKYNGRWEKIDGHFAEGFAHVREEVFDDPVLLEPDAAYGGQKPRRTFIGPRYRGGLSDHLPIVIVVYF